MDRVIALAFVVVRGDTHDRCVVLGKVLENALADPDLLQRSAQDELSRSGIPFEDASRYTILDIYPATEAAFVRSRLTD
jgi:hypothetical protein